MNKLLKESSLLTLATAYQQVLGIILALYLTKYLSPEEYGIMAMVTIYSSFVGIFSNIGFGQSIIAEKVVKKGVIETLFWLGVIIGLGTFVLVNALSSFANQYFGQNISELLFLFSFIFLIRPLFIINRRLLEKKLEFKVLGVIDIFCVSLSSLAAFLFVINGYGVKSLVFQMITLNLLYFMAFNFFYMIPLKFKIEIVLAKSLIKYAFKYKLSESLLFFDRNLDLIVVTGVFDSITVGLYSLVNKTINAPIKKFSHLAVSILFPVFAHYKRDPKKQGTEIFFKLVCVCLILVLPFSWWLSCNAEIFVSTALGSQWHSIFPIIEILSYVIGVQAVELICISYLPTLDNGNVFIKSSFVKVFLTASFLVIASFFTIEIFCYAILISKTLGFILSIHLALKASKDSENLLKKLLVVLLCSVFVIFSCSMLIKALSFKLEGKLVVSTLIVILVFGVLTLYKKNLKQKIGN